MTKTFLCSIVFTLILFASINKQLYGQISKIKKESQKNEESKKPKPKPKPKPVSTIKKPPAVDPCKIPPNPNPLEITYDWPEAVYITNNEPIASSEEYNFDGCIHAFSCLNSLAFFSGDLIRKLDTIKWSEIDPTFVSWDVRAHFDLGYHYSTKQHYTYADYLPGLRMSLGLLMFDFRYNILTEYTDDLPDSFKSWELLLLFNLLPRKDLKMFIGTGIHREKYSNQSFNEIYLGIKYNPNQNKDFIDADIRTSVDYKTGAFPFFEIGTRYNIQLLNIDNTFGYITIGASYQNYYQTHDIWSLRSGIIVNVH